MNQNQLSGLMSALCIGLMWIYEPTPGALGLVGVGAAVMATVCLLSEL